MHTTTYVYTLVYISYPGIILCMGPAIKRRPYYVTPFLIDWTHTQNDPCYHNIICFMNAVNEACRPGGHNWDCYPDTLCVCRATATLWKIGYSSIHLRVNDIPVTCSDLLNMWRYEDRSASNGHQVTCPNVYFISHYSEVTMSAMTSQITGISGVCSTVCWSAHQRKHQSSASLAFVKFNSDQWFPRTKGQ